MNVQINSKAQELRPKKPMDLEKELAEIKELTKLGTIRTKVLYTVEDISFLTGFSTDTIYTWIHKGRRISGGKKIIFLKPASGLIDRGFRFFPDELDHFLSHFPPAKA